ncbi:MAG: YceI family protein [Bacteroidetes bacterium]|nr:MAG: YceI family protein [Bacteroidota bacterium]
MKHHSFSLTCLTVVTFFALCAFQPLKVWTIKAEQTRITFSIKNAGFTVTGTFSEVSGTIDFGPKNLKNSRIDARVKVASIHTGIKARDKHLRSADYFEADTYPDMHFRSTSIEKTAGGYKARGLLTIKDVSREVEIPFTFENNTFRASFSLDRTDYHVGKKSWIMGEEVQVELEVKV